MSTGSQIKSVALLTDGVSPLVMGGMQKHSFYLLKYLLGQGIRIHLYHTGPGSIVTHLNEVDTRLLLENVISFPQQSKAPWGYLRASLTYSQLIYQKLKTDAVDIDFIYAQGFTAWHLLDRKKKGEQWPAIGVNFHGLEMFQKAAGVKQKLIQHLFKGPVRFNLEQADVVYSLGTGLTEVLEKNTSVDRSRISQIPIALDPNWELSGNKNFAADRLKVLFIGRYERRKGIEELTEAINTIAPDRHEFHFVGPIPQHKRIEREDVIYYGRVSDTDELRSILDTCHILIVPSYSEGMPTVILEAKARGLIVIASEVGAVSDQLTPDSGVLINPGSPAAIVNALKQLGELGSARMEEMSINTRREFQQKFTWPRVIERTIEDMRIRTSRR